MLIEHLSREVAEMAPPNTPIDIRSISKDKFLALEGCGLGLWDKLVCSRNMFVKGEELKFAFLGYCERVPETTKAGWVFSDDLIKIRNEKKSSEMLKQSETESVSKGEKGPKPQYKAQLVQGFKKKFKQGDDWPSFRSFFQASVAFAEPEAQVLTLRNAVEGVVSEYLEAGIQACHQMGVDMIACLTFLQERFHREALPQEAMNKLLVCKQEEEELPYVFLDRVRKLVVEAFPNLKMGTDANIETRKSLILNYVSRGMNNSAAAEHCLLSCSEFKSPEEFIKKYEEVVAVKAVFTGKTEDKNKVVESGSENPEKVSRVSEGSSEISELNSKMDIFLKQFDNLRSEVSALSSEVAVVKRKLSVEGVPVARAPSRFGSTTSNSGGGVSRPSNSGGCWVCHDKAHFMRDCPKWRGASSEEMRKMRNFATSKQYQKVRAVLLGEEIEFGDMDDPSMGTELEKLDQDFPQGSG